VRKFSVYDETRGVWKGWDYVVLPDGRRVDVAPGKYVRVFSEEPLTFGFEDMTEEVGEAPDYDFDEPLLTVVGESGFVTKNVRLRAKYGGSRKIRLYYGNTEVHVFSPGFYTADVEFTYTEVGWLMIAAAIPAAAGLLILFRKK